MSTNMSVRSQFYEVLDMAEGGSIFDQIFNIQARFLFRNPVWALGVWIWGVVFKCRRPVLAGLAVHAVHVFMNICSHSLFANSVQK